MSDLNNVGQTAEGYIIDIQDEFGASDLPLDRMQAAMIDVLTRHNAPKGTMITVIVMGDEGVRDLNRQYRDVDAPTDVLSFPAEPLPQELQTAITEAGEDDALYLGDLILAYPYTASQAAAEGHDRADEFVLLVIHGTLHLLGYDHDSRERQTAMWDQQRLALRAAGIAFDVSEFPLDD
ncbi:MAG TPA: rRNA maturation RNase YbeY [Aggregatilineales bacterium]|nr:rRNA maturation RNase YbeY [Anaerolineales bacterium]HRE47182.1 rRNA maturation RNase YbeY [Aggregatilineales bacterium]